MRDVLKNLFKSLDMDYDNGLATNNNISSMSSYQKYFFNQVHEKLGIDAVYFLRDTNGIAKIPLIYFTAIEESDPQICANLHKLAWNLGEAPLLFIVTPDELKIFNNYDTPKIIDGKLSSDAGLLKTIKLTASLAKQREQLDMFKRLNFETGDFWKVNKMRFSEDTRVDITLMNNLKIMRRVFINRIRARLAQRHLSYNVVEIVHGLLSRSILIKYLEERRDSDNNSVFPVNFYSHILKNATCYADILNNKRATYKLYEILEEKFNGDMLPLVPGEIQVVNEDDLSLLRDFLIGNNTFANREISLWPLYSFDIIPIQLISNIYELFFHLSETSDDTGTYYTPLHLVYTLMDEVYPWEGKFLSVTILDPACGSGIFLVEAYRRMICRWMHSNNRTTIGSKELSELLTKHVFGVDINREAIRVASFSLTLVMCDFLDPKRIWDTLTFPKLCDKNLFAADFFNQKSKFNKNKYDIVIGNPPWKSELTDLANAFLKEKQKVVGDKQIAQAFSLKCAQMCKKDGQVCLLMPSKGFLFNRSNKTQKYRKAFFDNYNVNIIINFSVYRKYLFNNATAPAVGVIYSNRKKNKGPIFYCTPKPLYTLEDTRKFSIEPTDIYRIPFDVVQDDRIWKIAMWGGPRDLELIDRVQNNFITLENFLTKHDMKNAEGYKIGNGKNVCKDFIGMPLINVRLFTEFKTSKDALAKVDFVNFECTTKNNREIYKAPHLIIKQSPKGNHFLSSVLEYDALFNHSFLGIHGNISLLKYLSLIIGSKFFSYYHLMTNRRWLIERDELEAGDIKQTPIPEPDQDELIQATKIYDDISNGAKVSIRDEYVNTLYGFKSYEIESIYDSLNYVYDYFTKKGKSFTFDVPDKNQYIKYGKILIDILKNTFGRETIHDISYYVSNAPLSVIVLSLGKSRDMVHWFNGREDLNNLLNSLNETLVDSHKNIYVRRNVRIYDKDAIYIIKPHQKKYWNYTSACRDADEIFTDIMNKWEAL